MKKSTGQSFRIFAVEVFFVTKDVEDYSFPRTRANPFSTAKNDG
jgi:hypothetical protein